MAARHDYARGGQRRGRRYGVPQGREFVESIASASVAANVRAEGPCREGALRFTLRSLEMALPTVSPEGALRPAYGTTRS